MRTIYEAVQAEAGVRRLHGRAVVPGMWYVVRCYSPAFGPSRNFAVVGGPYYERGEASFLARIFRESDESAHEPKPEEAEDE